jgi:uncharacterized membrane protein YeaQ/YmgE (transglycosylase-associated protein family)
MASETWPKVLLVIVLIGIQSLWGYGASRIMKRKNRSVGAGWVLGMVLGIVGIGIAAVLRPSHEATQTVRCPHCNASQEVPEWLTLLDCAQCEQEIRLAPPTGAPPRGTDDAPADTSFFHEHSGPVDDMPGLSDVGWQKQMAADVQVHGPEAVLKAMVETGNVTAERGYTKEAFAALHRHKRAGWALPRVLALDPEGLRLIDGVYFRAWVCELDGVTVDGHSYADGRGSCTVCGR